MPDESDEALKPFRLTEGGPFFRVERRLGITREGVFGLALRTTSAIGIGFVPLVVLAAVEGVLVGSRVALPLAADLTVYARFLIGVPLLLYAERFIDARFAMGVTHFRTAHILEGQARTDFEAALRRLERARDSLLPETLLLITALAMALIGGFATLGRPVSSWIVTTPGLASSVTWAGRWLQFVSMPIFTFLVLRWLWRMLIWSRFLRHVSHSDLRLVPTHPDGAGGLAFLGTFQRAFGVVLIPLAASVAARGVQWVQFGGGTIESLRNAVIAFGVIALLVSLGPLLLFAPKLFAVRRRGLLEYARLATDYTRDFDRRWLREGPSPEQALLGTSDIQSLADLANSFQVIQRMRLLPLTRQDTLVLVSAAILPMLPFWLVIVPVDQLLKQVAQLVLR